MIRQRAPFSRFSVRARLLLAFTILSASAMVLAMVGWLGLSNTDQALKNVEQQALPEVSRSLELAERTASLAALAPYVASVNVPFLLQGESQKLQEKIQTVLDLAQTIPQLDAAAPKLEQLLQNLESTVNELIELTRQQLYLREDIRQHHFQLTTLHEQLQQSLRSVPDSENVLAGEQLVNLAGRLVDQLLAASNASDQDSLNNLQRRFAELTQHIEGRVREWAGLPSTQPMIPLINELLQVSTQENNVFQLRRQQLQLQQRSAFLLASTRAISEQLSGEVKTFVEQVQNRLARQSQFAAAAVTSGKTGIVAITLLCVLAALGGIWLVRELALNLGAVTRLMTRLAEGDTLQETPAIERRDEIGSLARAFNVFRQNAVAMDRMTQHLQEQTRMLETLFNNINDGLSVFDRDGKLVAWNPQYLSILNLPEDQIRTGMRIEEVQTLLARESHESRALNGMPLDMQEINLKRQQQPQRLERYYASGKVVELRSSPLPDGGFVTLYSDLTERKTVEAQLRQSQKMEVLGQLTGGVAHDFNNLLAAVIGNLQLLESSLNKLDDAGKSPTYARRALSAAERGASLTHRLLAFSRKQRLEPEPTEVDELIEGMLDLVEYSMGSNIEIKLNLDTAHWPVHVDPGQLENALLNLAINSRSAMPEGGTLTFTTQTLENTVVNQQPGDYVLIRVSDTGCGIPKEHLNRVFEPFYTTKEIGEGSGLGLSMVYGFVKQSGGDIRIHSQVGQGTEVEILLPRLREERSGTQQTLAVSAMPHGRQQRILIVEDDPQVLMAAEEMLEQLGYQPLSASSAAEAIAILEQEEQIALVFSDINLGSATNGLQLLETVAQRWPHIRSLLTSGLSISQLSSQFGLKASQFVLAKPYRMEELARAVAEALEAVERD